MAEVRPPGARQCAPPPGLAPGGGPGPVCHGWPYQGHIAPDNGAPGIIGTRKPLHHDKSVLSLECPVSRVSCVQYVLSPECPVSRVSCLQSVLSLECPVSRVSCVQSVLCPECLVSRVSCLQSVLSPECLVSRVSCVQSVLSPECPVLHSCSSPSQQGRDVFDHTHFRRTDHTHFTRIDHTHLKRTNPSSSQAFTPQL
ncbi:hypothetical protein D4764_18G0004390 [Takifugu flavidus]|uniref:Uncharacterized protein n=1 Tax=Takifugu flavidus TaxID=433684 RepID=A0A5C6NQX1_9TELE|nr:hypothetical protein D4764_18G0004390 [Takifugu flavidus]